MVFPSLGCNTCKRRHLKCDSARPLCGRCRKGGLLCTWAATEEEGLPFRSENAFAQGRPRRPRKVHSCLQDSTAVTARSHPTILPALSFPLELHSVNYWVKNWAFGTNDLPGIGHEYTSYVISHKDRARQDSSLHLAFLAFALAVFGRARKVRKALEDANRFYSQTIAKVKTEIKDVATEDIDQLLITIMLMGTYENIMWGLNPHNPQNPSCSSDEVGSRFWQNVCHHKGAAGLLRLRQLRRLPKNLPLDRVVRRQIIRIIILRGKTIPGWLQDPSYEEKGPMRELDALILRAAGLRARSLHLFKNNSGPKSRDSGGTDCCSPPSHRGISREVAAEAQDLDAAFVTWSKTAPEEWRYSTIDSRTTTTDELYDCPVHAYASHGHAAVWNRYRAVRLIVNSIRIRSLATLIQCPMQASYVNSQQEIETSQKNIESLARDLCGGVLFFFHSCNPLIIGGAMPQKMAALLAWPLTVAVSTEGVPGPQRRWLLERLNIVAEILGDVMLASVISKGEFRF
ncbi:uncharacterized protein BDR25DRAFT_212412 [Lindgomyces ingoldianus]|uniref:Uncharacterized protein n=1 Tax=Lindgomyces ingoldianus TaxID=673940 RepID=A0ACB6R9S8_9PLEO|nr:uncharacterized protein BDR25DRAFT_212412 [Lindgomyces ingoldianus]KAF2476004.1 hypothetical protein BDR25DRAFT_212412 [Lindgomyces ingoldianus]